MRKFLFTLMLFGGVFLSIPAFAVERIDRFDAIIQIREDAAIEVSEKIEYDFGAAQKHGIFRDMPIKYKARGGNYNFRISDISVTDEKGAAYKFTTSYPSNNVQIKIGDPNVEITGKYIYVINYIIKRAINYFNDHDELYWNITGNEWPVAIGSATAKIILPQKIESGNIQADCFAGPFGSTQKCNSILKGLGEADSVSFSENQLSVGEGLTIVVGIPKGIIRQPTALESALDTAKDNGIVALPIFVLVICFYLWYTRGRDPAGRGIIIAQYDPPDNLTPSEVGVIADEQAQSKDISAAIIHLAVRGYIKIIQTEEKILFISSKDYTLQKIKSEEDLIEPFEKNLMQSLFKSPHKEQVKFYDLRNEFYKDFEKIKNMVYSSVVDKGYFQKNPQKIRKIYTMLGTALILISIFGFVFLGIFFGFIGIVSAVITGVIVVVFGYLMPARTKRGVLAREHILGLKLYMSVAEKRRIEFHNAPEKNPAVFEKLLPYAIALGVEKQWAKQFEGIYMEQPNWYHGTSGAVFNAAIFATSMSNFSNTAGTTMASSPSGGSGFSGGGAGGGGGGGGGGSW